MRWTPGCVESVDRPKRLVRVSFPGVTAAQGAEEFPVAQVCYATGEQASDTEIRIDVGALVWLDFIGGDWASPIILGFRAAESGNESGTRRVRGEAIELLADDDMVLKAEGGTLVIKAGETIKIQAANLEFVGLAKFTQSAEFAAGINVSGGSLTHLSQPVGATHHHTSSTPGSPTSPVSGG